MPFILSVVMLCSASCRDKNKPAGATSQKAINTEDTASQCYYYITDKDTVSLRLRISEEILTGQLNYSFSEKDRNSGAIIGHMFGDTLVAEYTFQSEGTSSVREVVFIKTGDSFTEGYGEMKELNGKMYFQNLKSLNFNTGVVLKKMNCE